MQKRFWLRDEEADFLFRSCMGFFFLQLQQVVQIFVESEANSVGSSTSVGSIHGHQTLIYCTAIKYDKDLAFKDAYGLLGG